MQLEEQLEELQGDNKKKISAETVQKHYNDNVKVSAQSEPVNKSWVELAILVYNRALVYPEVVVAIKAQEGLGAKSPFHYITVLHSFVTKGRTAESIKWAFVATSDLVLCKELRIADLAVRNLVGDGATRAKGLVDLFLLQKDMKEYLLGPALNEIGLGDCYTRKLREVFKTHDSYRAMLTAFLDADQKPNASWQVGWPAEVSRFLAFVEDLFTSSSNSNRSASSNSNAKSDNDGYQ